MGIEGILSAIIVGAIIGALARLLVPGKQSMGMLLTIGLGIVGAFVGLVIAQALGLTGSVIMVLLLQIAVAALLVFLAAGGSRSRGRTRTRV